MDMGIWQEVQVCLIMIILHYLMDRSYQTRHKHTRRLENDLVFLKYESSLGGFLIWS